MNKRVAKLPSRKFRQLFPCNNCRFIVNIYIFCTLWWNCFCLAMVNIWPAARHNLRIQFYASMPIGWPGPRKDYSGYFCPHRCPWLIVISHSYCPWLLHHSELLFQTARKCNRNILKWVFLESFLQLGQTNNFVNMFWCHWNDTQCIGDKSLSYLQKSYAKDMHLQSNTAWIPSARLLLFPILLDCSNALFSDLSVPAWWAPTTIPYLFLINFCYRSNLIFLIWIYSGISQSREILDQDIISRNAY